MIILWSSMIIMDHPMIIMNHSMTILDHPTWLSAITNHCTWSWGWSMMIMGWSMMIVCSMGWSLCSSRLRSVWSRWSCWWLADHCDHGWSWWPNDDHAIMGRCKWSSMHTHYTMHMHAVGRRMMGYWVRPSRSLALMSSLRCLSRMWSQALDQRSCHQYTCTVVSINIRPSTHKAQEQHSMN